MASPGPLTPSDVKRPAVLVVAVGPLSQEILDPVLWGLEEEGIPAELLEVEGTEVEHPAKLGADSSPLNVGIAIHGEEKTVALHHRDLPAERPLFVLNAGDFSPSRLRLVGVNGARLVKGEPLVFDEGPADFRNEQSSTWAYGAEMEQLVEVITRVVMELLEQRSSQHKIG